MRQLMITVLFSSAGRRTELLNCFRHDALLLGESLRVLAVDVQPEFSSACHSADAFFRAPHCLDEDFIPRPRHVGAAMRQGEDVGTPEERGQFGVAHIALHETHPARRREPAQALHRDPERPPHHPQLRVGHVPVPEGLEQHVDTPLYSRTTPK